MSADSERCFVDTNVLMYAHDTASEVDGNVRVHYRRPGGVLPQIGWQHES